MLFEFKLNRTIFFFLAFGDSLSCHYFLNFWQKQDRRHLLSRITQCCTLIDQRKCSPAYRKWNVGSDSYACPHAVTFHWCSSKFAKWMLTGGNLDLLDSSPTMWVFKCFLCCIYLLLYLKSVIAILFQQIRSYFSTSLRTCTHGKIRDDSRNLTKLPRHISFVVLESDISFVDLAQLIVWSMAMGIPYISVYDREGVLKKNAAAFSSEIIRKQKEVFLEESSKYTFVLRTKDVKFDCEMLAPTQVCISLLSENDGKRDIVEAAREFCQEIQTKQRALKEMEPDLLNSLLKATHGIPDPELAFKFGNMKMIMGYLPWQTRLTEFLPLRTHISIDYSTFLSSLRRFGQCQQRFGK